MGVVETMEDKISEFVKRYTDMEINGDIIHCPYWMNKLKEGKVVLRGFTNGKGSAQEIREEIIQKLKNQPQESQFELTPENLRKFARRERIGIDCSGFVYRVLDELLRLGYGNTKYENLDNVFGGGIGKTNTRRLTDPQYSREIKDINDFRLGDMIRLWGGKHIAIIIKNTVGEILYAHSSHLSAKTQGVHTSSIRIITPDKPLAHQEWLEETRIGDKFGQKYFHPEKGDGVFRLKIFT